MKEKLSILFSIFTAVLISTPVMSESLKGRWSVFLEGSQGEYNYTLEPSPSIFINGTNAFKPLPSTSTRPEDQAFDNKINTTRSYWIYSVITPKTYALKTTQASLGTEYHFADHFGFTLGLSGSTGNTTCISGCEIDSMTIFLLSLNSGSPPSGYTGSNKTGDPSTFTYMMGILNGASKGLQTQAGLLELGINFHLLPDGIVDPYLGLSAGGGQGTVDLPGNNHPLSVSKGRAKLGFRVNASSHFFMYAQAEYVQEKWTGDPINYPASAFGLGVTF